MRSCSAELRVHENWCGMSVTLRRVLFGRQAGCYYINTAWCPGPVSHRRLVRFKGALICLSYPGKVVLPRGAAPRTFRLSTGCSAVELEEDGCQTPVMLRTEPAYETDRVAGRLA